LSFSCLHVTHCVITG